MKYVSILDNVKAQRNPPGDSIAWAETCKAARPRVADQGAIIEGDLDRRRRYVRHASWIRELASWSIAPFCARCAPDSAPIGTAESRNSLISLLVTLPRSNSSEPIFPVASGSLLVAFLFRCLSCGVLWCGLLFAL
jgi:hypothetical protein